MKRVAVVGGGSFGTVIAGITAGNGHEVRFWMRSREAAEAVNSTGENRDYLPGWRLGPRVAATCDMAEAVRGGDVVFVAVPSASFRAVARELAPFLGGEAMLISTTKGIEAGAFRLMSQILAEEHPGHRVGALSGPNLAKEIAAGDLTGTVIASVHEEVRETVRDLLRSETFRVYTNGDVFGVELGGSLKNVYAIMAGIAAALGMGHNANSMLITRSLAEMARFGRALGADPMTFLGLAGVGDLVVTCSTPLSRNYRVGQTLGRGGSVAEALERVGQAAEGVNSVRQVKEKAEELGVYMPLVTGLYRIIHEGESMKSIIASLMLSEQALDVEFAAGRAKAPAEE